MADRAVKVRLEANVEGFKAGMRTAAQATQDFAKRSDAYIQNHRQSINDVSNAALVMGAGLVTAAGLGAKAAMDWESAWAGVEKTVEGTDAQMAGLEAGLRDMAKNLPATHSEIAAVAEAAGQLGISTPNIESFTKTMIDLGEATNLSAEEAATSLARFSNITGTSQGDIDKLGAAVVGLGNNFATTESEIVTMGQRLAGAGEQAGLSEGDILGVAAAMSSVGIEAEAGGSAMSQTMKRIGKAVDEGSDSLDLFAQVSGMTSEEFSEAWQNDPVTALDSFITGLSTVESQGMTTNGVLSELGITGIRESDSLLRLSAASERGAEGMSLLAEAVESGNSEFEAGTALVEEATKRYETAESRIAMMRNTLVDAAIDIGGAVAPAISDAADNVSFLVEKFQELPGAAKSALGAGAGVTGLALLAVGGLGKALTSASDLKLAMKELGWTTMETSKKMKLLGIGSAVGLAITGLTLALGHFVSEGAEAEAMSDSLVESFDDLTGAATAGTDELILDKLNEALDKGDWDRLKELGFTYEEVVAAIKEGGPALDELNKKISLADWDLPTTGAKDYEVTLRELKGASNDAAEAYSMSRDQLALEEDQMGKTGVSAEELAAATENAAAKQEVLDSAVEETGVQLDGTIEKLGTFLGLLFETGLATMSARDAQFAYEESMRGIDETVDTLIEKHGGLGAALNDAKTDFDDTTEAGKEANDAFQDVARSGFDVAESMAEAGASQEDIQGSLQGTYDDLIAAAGQFGITGEKAEDLAREVLGIPDGVDIETWMSDAAEKQAEATQGAVDRIDKNVTVTTNFVTIGDVPAVQFNGGAGRPGGTTAKAAQADGSVLDFYANGGLREHHTAQIAPAGAWRVWAEPETGGEAYIPLSMSKRGRSEQILADVAKRFGMGVQKFDNGGMYMPSATPVSYPQDSSSTHTYVFNNYNTDAVRAVREQVAQLSHKQGQMPVGVPG